MKWLNGYKTRMVLVGCVAVIVLGGGNAKADFTFGEPTNLGPMVNSSSWDVMPTISSDGLTMYFASNRPGGYGNIDLWVSTRPTTEDKWGEPENLGPPVNSSVHDQGPNISADGLTLYFSDYYSDSPRPGGLGGCDIWKTTRATTGDDWGEPVNLGSPINSATDDLYPCISPDGLSLYFTSHRYGYGNSDLWVSTRAAIDDPWSEPVNLGQTVNTSEWDSKPAISADGCVLFFGSDRSGSFDIWMTKRTSMQDDWTAPVHLPINTGYDACSSALSADGRTLYFFSRRPGGSGGYDIWQSPIAPIMDFNGDGIVDAADMCIMVDHWGTNYSLCDIGPTPLGDGVVDVQDLIVLAEHLFEDYRLIAQWKLDEAEGAIAFDSVNVNDGSLNGDPTWQPGDGMLGGALKFDGVDDYLSTPFLLNPGETSFSIFAWIKGGASGQVIISQADDLGERTVIYGSTWLGTGSTDGRLMTGLMDIYFGPLESESVITDDQWHHIGLVYDIIALKRHLYVDGEEVMMDTGFIGGVQSSGGLYIGAGQDLGPDTFFSGLIDDVRIYDAALSVEEIEALVQ